MRAELDAEFASYVRARERQFLRAAYLVCGDAHLAEDLLQQALVKLASRWDKVRTESPGAFVRKILYRDAVSSWRRTRRERSGLEPVERIDDGLGAGSPPGRHCWDGRHGADGGTDVGSSVGARVDMHRALGALTPKQRAVVVLRFFEDRSEREAAEVMGVSVGTVKSQTHGALGRLRSSIPSLEQHQRTGAEMTSTDLGTLLDQAGEHVREPDLAEASWRTAAAQQRRRRRVGAGAAAAVTAAALLVVVVPGLREDHPTPAPTPSTSPQLHRTREGMPYVMAPRYGTESTLPVIDAGLPPVVSLRGRIYPLSEVKLRRVAAVVLKPLGADRYRPVLIGPQGSDIEVESVTLTMPPGEGLHQNLPLSAGAVAPDGHRVVFPDITGITVVDTESGVVSRVPVPAAGGRLADAGWAVGADAVVASDGRGSWLIDPTRRTIRELRLQAPAGHYSIEQGGAGSTVLRTWNAAGMTVATAPLRAPRVDPWLGPESDTLGWVAQAVFTNTEGSEPIPTSYQGILTVQGDVPSTARLLAMPNDNRFKGCCQPLGWLGGVHLLYTTRGQQGTWLLSWDVVTGRVERVSKVDVPAIALGPLDF